jgi:putative ATP-binding cassette transporter
LHRGAVQALALARKSHDRLLEHFHGVTDGAKELQLHAGRREDFLENSLKDVAKQFHRVAVRGMNYYTVAGAWSQLLLATVLGLFVFAFASWGVAAPGNAAAFGLTLLYLSRPLDVVVQMLPILGRARVAVDKVESLGLALGKAAAPASSAPPRVDWTTLELVDLYFSYPSEPEDERFHVGPIDLCFSPGEVVFITGGNGSGKSTLAKLILGLYPPERGFIRLDGEKVGPDNIERYRRRFSAVFSDFHLFRRIHGLEKGDEPGVVQKYLDEFHLTEKVRLHDGVFDFAGLSQGQRKRLALATAYLEDRPIYLFDEWAADQDPHFRDVFYTRLLPELKAAGKLVLVVSHDDRYFGAADRIVKMEGGRIASIGPPAAAAESRLSPV